MLEKSQRGNSHIPSFRIALKSCAHGARLLRSKTLALSVCCLAVIAATRTGDAWASPRIELGEFRIEPGRLKLGESFVIHARAVASEVQVRSFLLRTAEEVRREDTIPGLPLYSNGNYYVAEDGKYFLKDNGALDEDPRALAFALKMSTRDWKEGTYTFAFFTSCRPSEGPFIVARHEFAVVVKDQQVLIEDLGPSVGNRSRAITSVKVQPSTVTPGEPVMISVEPGAANFQGMQLTNPYYIAAADTLPGFYYDKARKKSFFGKLSAPLIAAAMPSGQIPIHKTLALKLDTTGWPPGIHHLLLNAVGFSGRPIDYRSFAIKVRGPQDQLDVIVEDSHFFRPGTHFGSFIRLRNRTLLCLDRYSRDGGRAWQGPTGGFGAGGEELSDGSVLGLGYECLPEKNNRGWYRTQRSFSTDGGRHFTKTEARLLSPRQKRPWATGLIPGHSSCVRLSSARMAHCSHSWPDGSMAIRPFALTVEAVLTREVTHASRTTRGSLGAIWLPSAMIVSAVKATTKARCANCQAGNCSPCCAPVTSGILSARIIRSCGAPVTTREKHGRHRNEQALRARIPALRS